MKSWSVVGHRWAVQQLQQAVAQDEVPHALLITGPESVGKSTLAEALVAAILCRSDGDKPCGECLSCRKLRSGNHPDVMDIGPEDRTSSLKISLIRDVERFLTLTPKESLHKVALIRSFERATIGAANALLKTLEEPPSFAHLILLATDADLLLPTIVSRTQVISLRPLSSREIEEALIARWEVEPGRARHLARISGGRMGWAIRAATDPETYGRMTAAMDTLTSVITQDLPDRFATAQELARDDATLSEMLEYWLTFWRDVLLLQTDNEGAVVYEERSVLLSAIAEAITMDETLRILEALEFVQGALLANANTQLLTENLLLNMPTVPLRPSEAQLPDQHALE
ncbi:MAG: DNA polymerase III subunit delta' [Anaerolineae bacterium]